MIINDNGYLNSIISQIEIMKQNLGVNNNFRLYYKNFEQIIHKKP